MHDRNGLPLKTGDIVLVPFVIKNLCGTEDYCNVGLESVYGRRPDGNKETLSSINTGVTLLADLVPRVR